VIALDYRDVSVAAESDYACNVATSRDVADLRTTAEDTAPDVRGLLSRVM